MARGLPEKTIRRAITSMLSKRPPSRHERWGLALAFAGLAFGFGSLLYTVLNPDFNFVIGLALAVGCAACLAAAVCVLMDLPRSKQITAFALTISMAGALYWKVAPGSQLTLMAVLLRLEKEVLERPMNSPSIPASTTEERRSYQRQESPPIKRRDVPQESDSNQMRLKAEIFAGDLVPYLFKRYAEVFESIPGSLTCYGYDLEILWNQPGRSTEAFATVDKLALSIEFPKFVQDLRLTATRTGNTPLTPVVRDSNSGCHFAYPKSTIPANVHESFESSSNTFTLTAESIGYLNAQFLVDSNQCQVCSVGEIRSAGSDLIADGEYEYMAANGTAVKRPIQFTISTTPR